MIQDDNGQTVEVKHLEANKSMKAIGVIQAVDRNMAGQVTALLEKMDKLDMGIRNGWVPHQLAWQGLHMMIWPSIQYPLPVMNFSRTEAEEINRNLTDCSYLLWVYLSPSQKSIGMPHIDSKASMSQLWKLSRGFHKLIEFWFMGPPAPSQET